MTWQQQVETDWRALWGTVSGALVLLGGGVAWWFKRGKEKGDTNLETQKWTMDQLYEYVEQIKDDKKEQAKELLALEDRCNDKIAALERRIELHETTIARQVQIIIDKEEEMRALRNQVSERDFEIRQLRAQLAQKDEH